MKRNIGRTTLKGVVTKMSVTFLFLALSTTIAAAVPVTFFGEDAGQGEAIRLPSHPNADAARTAFLAMLINPGVENLESFANGQAAPLAANFGAAGTATLNGNGEIANVPTGTNGVGRYPISGNQYWEATDSFSIDFTQPQVAFGFYGIDIGDFNGQVTILYENGVSQTLTIPNIRNGPGGSVLYFGFIDAANPFIKVTFGNTEAGTDYFGFDDFTIGTIEQVITIPEFPSIALPVGATLGLMFLLFRRREN